jgi:hypothetical protein
MISFLASLLLVIIRLAICILMTFEELAQTSSPMKGG